ncbi:MAG: hypothetical protein Q7J48_05160 [Nocardioides sp.]|nr:hypothetical protein [Nocardioides sp.]
MDGQRIRTLGRLGALALTAVLVLGACGGEADEPTDTAPDPEETTSATGPAPADEALDTEVPDLCGLFTAEDFETVTGETAGTPETQEPLGAIRGTCSMSAEVGFPVVMVAAYDEADREATLAMVDAEPVDDLGVEAYWDDTVGLVIPLEGKDWYLQVLALGGGADRETSVQVAEIVLDRL